MIQAYKRNEERLSSSNYSIAQFNNSQKSISKSQAKISLTKRRSTNKKTSAKQGHFSPLKGQSRESQEIEKKISKLQHQLQEIDNFLRVNSKQNQKLLCKINFALQSITRTVWTKLRNYQTILNTFLSTTEHKLKQIQQTITLLNFKNQIKVYHQQKNKNHPISDSDIQESEILSSLQLYVPRHLINQQNEDIETKSISLSLDQLNQSNKESSHQNLLQVCQVEKNQKRILHLQNTLRNRGIKLPMRVYIDQNGYLKDFRTETSTLDDSSELFQLTANQIEQLRIRKVIY